MRVSGRFEGQGTLQRLTGHQTLPPTADAGPPSIQFKNQVELRFLTQRESLPFPFRVRSSTLSEQASPPQL